MKWGRKKSPGVSPLPQIFPISWLSMLKQKTTTPRTNSRPSKPKQQNNKQESPKTSSSIPVCFRSSRPSDAGGIDGRYNAGSSPVTREKSHHNLTEFAASEDDFWKFSFEKRRNGSRDGRDWLEDDEIEFQFSSRESDGSITPKKHHRQISPNSGKSGQNIAKENNALSSNSLQKLQMSEEEEQRREDRVAKSPRRNRDLQRRKIRHRPKTGERSPRTGLRMEVCKIRAVEDIKKAEKKRRRRRRRKEKQRGRDFKSFAVVKSSFNPQEDFRESMIDMICANRIGEEEEMENLLACYLSLNSDEHHDIILKVFRQVWFDLIQDSSDSEFE